jgi:SAM-dependent methyltransferase
MITKREGLNKNSNVVEIACNDGYLLQYFQEKSIPAYGIEPAENPATEARKKGLDVVSDFFGESLALSLKKSRGAADLIIGNNVIAHVPDINSFVKGLFVLLAPDGCITLEFPHLLRLIEFNQFDTIYHEHYSYFSLLALKKIFESHGLKITKVEELSTHGGSLRVYAAHSESTAKVEGSVADVLSAEVSFGLDKIETYTRFNETVRKIKRDALGVLCKIKDDG